MKKTLLASDVLMAGGAAVTLLLSFFGFSEFYSAWSTDGLAFASTVPAILALVMLAWYIAEGAGVNLPADVLTFTPAQLKATWGIGALGTMLAWVTVDFSKDASFWIQILGTAAMAGGAVAALRGQFANPVIAAKDDSPPPPPPPPPFAPGEPSEDS